MTRIEKQMYRALERDEGQYTLAHVAALYAAARAASHRVYNKIDWTALDAAIKRVRGQKGLDYVKREAARQQ